MVERSKRGKGKHKLLGNHQKSWIWGRNLVLETLRGGKWQPVELLIADHFTGDDCDEAKRLASDSSVPGMSIPLARLPLLIRVCPISIQLIPAPCRMVSS